MICPYNNCLQSNDSLIHKSNDSHYRRHKDENSQKLKHKKGQQEAENFSSFLTLLNGVSLYVSSNDAKKKRTHQQTSGKAFFRKVFFLRSN